MGLILPQTVKVRTHSSNYKHYREKGYEFKKCREFIEVNVLDLYPGSTTKVKVVCDICGKESEMWYGTVVECNKENKLITCGSNSCRNKKYEDTCMKKYGVKNAAQLQEIQDKIKDTNLERYGCICSLQSEEIQNKAKATWQKNYGENIMNPGQAQVVKDKIKATWKNNYGEDIENPFQLESVREKSKQTLQENYGENIMNPMQVKEIKNKVLDSFQFNGTGPCSRQQKYIHFLIGGTLNKRVCNSLVDICFEEEKIAIEYDGGGHFLADKFNGNKMLSKEALLKEKNREDSIVNKGYKVIRFIATKDRIPSDEVILNLIEEFKNSDFKVIRIDFEEGTIDRDYEEKWYCNFGELRRITKEDLEQFESEKIINLK